MRYLDIDTTPRISKIGLGTWQFGVAVLPAMIRSRMHR